MQPLRNSVLLWSVLGLLTHDQYLRAKREWEATLESSDTMVEEMAGISLYAKAGGTTAATDTSHTPVSDDVSLREAVAKLEGKYRVASVDGNDLDVMSDLTGSEWSDGLNSMEGKAPMTRWPIENLYQPFYLRVAERICYQLASNVNSCLLRWHLYILVYII